MTERKETNFIAIHCSATRPSMDVGAKDIRKWHLAKGWADIGYHYVIRRNGKVEPGRAENQIGAHVEGHNHESVGVCLVGGVSEENFEKAENNFTGPQFVALATLLKELRSRYPKAVIQGHRDFPGVTKACPSFDAKAWAEEHGLA